MIYNKSVYEPVKSEFAERRVIARRKLASRREEVYTKVPRVQEIDTEIETTGLRITKLALSGREDIDAAVSEIKENTAKLKVERKQLLESAGFTEDYMTNVYACNKCKDTGDINGEMCECFEKELVKQTLKLSKIAPALAKITFDDFDINYYPDVTDADGNNPRKQIDNILANCHNFICDFNKPDNKDLLFYGQTGRGKTFISAVVANEVAKRGYSVMYYTARELFEMLKDNSFTFNEELKEKCRQAYDVDLLIIDDLGSEPVNTYTTAAFFDILNARLISGKRMIINSNLNPDEIKNTYSTRIFSRLTDFNILKFIGDDIRVKRSEK
ncbi:MAG: ATP-binding protein [Clostridia bacterium]|nr:ATP-binding protein [Clostridia bacterium]